MFKIITGGMIHESPIISKRTKAIKNFRIFI